MAKDKFHDNVREALQKEGWAITAELMRIDLGETDIEVDLVAEMSFTAERGTEKIAVEVKSFLGRSLISEFHSAMGQYMDYRDALEEYEPDRVLFLAMPAAAFNHRVFQGRFVQRRLQREAIKIIVFDQLNNTIITWKK